MESEYRVLDQMVDHARGFCPELSVTSDQLDLFQIIPIEEVRGSLGVLESSADV